MSSHGLPKLPKIPKFSDLPPHQVTPLVLRPLEVIHQQQERIQQLRDEVVWLQGKTPRPKIRLSRLEKPARGANKGKLQAEKTSPLKSRGPNRAWAGVFCR